MSAESKTTKTVLDWLIHLAASRGRRLDTLDELGRFTAEVMAGAGITDEDVSHLSDEAMRI